MRGFLLRRLWQAVIVLILVSAIVFALAHLTGDPARTMVSIYASEADIQKLRHELGLDRPAYVQYAVFLWSIVRGDLGTSLRYRRPNVSLVLERFPATLELALSAMTLALLVAVPAGVLSAVRRNSVTDYAARLAATLGQSIPFFWLAMMLILIFAVHLGWLPTSGRDGVHHLILPSLTLSTYPMARITRLLRAGLLDVLQADYVRTARSKGLAPMAVLLRHAMKNALLPVITVVGLQLGEMLGGAVITETIFAWPGLGRLAIEAVESRDYPLIQAVVVFISALFVIANLAVDLTYGYLDPRIKYK